ncbi:hypothetical protein V7S43_005518 [Phytophthora oleae]|uniref:Condensation domain-containing protein n=1 Tax=Phytophthora oleae TaxID=2107226 RepID=A0ABD3FS63_9STRA
MQTMGESFTAEIQEPISLDDISSKNLLRIRRFSPSETTFERWEQYAEDDCNVAIDRYTLFPYFLTVWIHEEAEQARLMLFSDHYMSDGYSGMVVLNCTLEQVALLSKHEDLETREVSEYPLRVSLYENSLSDLWLSKPLLKSVITLFGKKLFHNFLLKFKPVLPNRSDQRDFTMPPVQNPTSAFFAEGSPSCMAKALAKCKRERVTFAGVLVSAVAAAFYHTATSQVDFDPCQPFNLMVDMDYNMCQRVPHSAEEDHVGAFIAFAELGWLLEEGVDMKTTSFWDLARVTRE